MKRTYISAIAALALLTGPAFADIDLGALSSGYSNAFGGGSVHAPDTFDFTLAGAEFLQLSATVSNTSLALGSTYLNLAEGGVTIASDIFTKGSSWSAGIGTTYPGISLSAGSYSFTINPAFPTSTSASVGYSVNVTGVPEISTWAMMFAGFAAIGFAGYRRRTVSFA